MAHKPLMRNYIYFETLEVGPDFIEDRRPAVRRFVQRRRYCPLVAGLFAAGADSALKRLPVGSPI